MRTKIGCGKWASGSIVLMNVCDWKEWGVLEWTGNESQGQCIQKDLVRLLSDKWMLYVIMYIQRPGRDRIKELTSGEWLEKLGLHLLNKRGL